MANDYTRTCTHCGWARLIPAAVAKEKGPKASQVRMAQRGVRFGFGKRRGTMSMQAMALQQQQDRVIENARCPRCGSTSYVQTKG